MKELIIIVYKIDQSLSASVVDHILDNIRALGLSDDEEIKENYIIKEIYIPSDETDVKVIYPVPKYSTSPEINELVSEITEKIKNDPTNQLKPHWDKIVRELKLRKINDSQ